VQTTVTRKVLCYWVHEVARVFSDRLSTEEDQKALFERLCIISRAQMREDLVASLKLDYGAQAAEPSVMVKGILFTDILPGRKDLDEVLPTARESLKQYLRKVLEDYNSSSTRPLSIVLFDYAVVHLLRICRIIKMAHGHAFLIGLEGSGRQSLTHLAASLCDHSLVDLAASNNYTEEQWREDLKACLIKSGQEGVSSVLLLPDAKIKGSFMLDDINNLLNSGDVPNLFPSEERV
jgi:dynein heavy chain